MLLVFLKAFTKRVKVSETKKKHEILSCDFKIENEAFTLYVFMFF